MLMLLIACIFRGFCFSLSICPWRETRELLPICSPLALTFCLQPPNQFFQRAHKILFNPLCPRQSLILHFESNNRVSRFKYVVEAELERRMKGPGVSCQEGQHLGLVLGLGVRM